MYAGCNSKVNVSGKVSFQDGTPVTIGKVNFEDDQHTYFGMIQSDGQYSVGGLRDGDGIPPGKYRVCVTGVITDDPTPKQWVAEKWTDSKKSGLEYDVKKSMVVDIEVERNPNP